MRVFVTGATGWVGSAVIQDLLAAGHTVTGLARSDASASALAATGVAVLRGSLEDLDSLRAGAAASDGVIHTAFNHDFSRFAESGAAEQKAIDAFGSALAGTARPLVVSSGVAFLASGRTVTEDDVRDASAGAFPRDPEFAAAAAAARGVHVSVIRLAPSVHGDGDRGFASYAIAAAREHRASAYVGDGKNRWPGVHRHDAAKLYRLALERGAEHAVYHAIADEGVPYREIAEVIGRRLNFPVVGTSGPEVDAHFGWFARFAQIDVLASSAKTRQTLGWRPTGPSLLADLDSTAYFPA